MITRIERSVATALGALSFLSPLVLAYDNVNVHKEFNAAIAECFSVTFSQDPTTCRGPAVTNPGLFDYTYGESDVDYTPLEWVKHGGYSADEPELAAAIRHFYDPLALNGGKRYLTNRGTSWQAVYPDPQTDAIEWALGDTPKGTANNWSLAKGKEHMVSVFELGDLPSKKRNMAKALRALGEVLHNTADMGCPPHVRNDSHAAPEGFGDGVLFGAPDPYERLFKSTYPALYSTLDPDPVLKSFFEGATTIRSIQERLATFTNANFFTEQTVNGTGRVAFSPINSEGTYPSPRLEALAYDTNDYTYSRDFPSGRRVKLCKDRRYFSPGRRGYPYIDPGCVESQAKELVPNIICAGVNVMRLFIPRLEVQITEVTPEGTIRGRVTHIPTAEYPDPIYYSGEVGIYDADTDQYLSWVNCNTGDFSGTSSELLNHQRVLASVSVPGITAVSEPYTIDSGLAQYNTAYVIFRANMPHPEYAGESAFTSDLIIRNSPIFDPPQQPLTWSGNQFVCSFNFTDLGTTYSGRISGAVSTDATMLISYGAYMRGSGASVFWIDSLSVANLPLTSAGYQGLGGLAENAAVQQHVTAAYRAFGTEGVVVCESSTIDWSAQPPPYLRFELYRKE